MKFLALYALSISLCFCEIHAELSGANKTPVRVALKSALNGQQLERKMIEMSASGGGVLVLPENSTLTATVHSLPYKNCNSPHALLVPEHVTLDLNGSTILLDFNSNAYGIRLASNAAIQNGTVRVIRSEGSGSQRIWHAPISVGAAYGDGGTPEEPSYFSRVVNWRIENMTVDQPFPKSAIQVMSEAAHGIIRDIRISDSAMAAIGIGFDWGTVGPLEMADARQKEMRALFEQGKLYGTHPHDILIQKIRIGRLLRHVDDDDSVGIRTSGCYNFTIDDVEVLEAGVGIAIRCGDAGYEYAKSPHREIGHAGYVIKNVKVHKALRKGILIDGIADNIYRAVRNHGHDAMLNTVDPGIDKPVVQNAWVRGGSFTGESGVTIQFSAGAKLENVDVAEFQKGLHLRDWTRDVTVSNSKIHDNKIAAVISGSEKKPENILLTNNKLFRNEKNIQASSGITVKEVNNSYHE